MSVNPKGIIEKAVESFLFTCRVLSISCFLLSLSRHKDSSHCSTLILKEKKLGPFWSSPSPKILKVSNQFNPRSISFELAILTQFEHPASGSSAFSWKKETWLYWSSQSPDEKQGNLFQGKPFSKHVPGLFQFRSCIHVKKNTFLHYLSDIIWAREDILKYRSFHVGPGQGSYWMPISFAGQNQCKESLFFISENRRLGPLWSSPSSELNFNCLEPPFEYTALMVASFP